MIKTTIVESDQKRDIGTMINSFWICNSGSYRAAAIIEMMIQFLISNFIVQPFRDSVLAIYIYK